MTMLRVRRCEGDGLSHDDGDDDDDLWADRRNVGDEDEEYPSLHRWWECPGG